MTAKNMKTPPRDPNDPHGKNMANLASVVLPEADPEFKAGSKAGINMEKPERDLTAQREQLLQQRRWELEKLMALAPMWLNEDEIVEYTGISLELLDLMHVAYLAIGETGRRYNRDAVNAYLTDLTGVDGVIDGSANLRAKKTCAPIVEKWQQERVAYIYENMTDLKERNRILMGRKTVKNRKPDRADPLDKYIAMHEKNRERSGE